MFFFSVLQGLYVSREKNDYLYSIRGIIRPSIEGITILQSREYFWIPLFLGMSCGRSVESLDCLPCCSEEANSVRWVVSKTRDRKKTEKWKKNVFLKKKSAPSLSFCSLSFDTCVRCWSSFDFFEA